MPLPTWIPAALSSETQALSATCWRAVESQYAVATMTLVDDADEQELLEEILEDSKPPVPEECRRLHYLLFTPFCYSVRSESRFHRAGDRAGIFYAALEVRTALAEVAFHRLLFFAESPRTPWPDRIIAFTVFSARVRTERAIDLAASPFDEAAELWRHPVEYAACQALAEQARERGVEAIRYASVRDPLGGVNLALLTCNAFAARKPGSMHEWFMRINEHGVMLRRAYGDDHLQFTPDTFAADPRIAAMNWQR